MTIWKLFLPLCLVMFLGSCRERVDLRGSTDRESGENDTRFSKRPNPPSGADGTSDNPNGNDSPRTEPGSIPNTENSPPSSLPGPFPNSAPAPAPNPQQPPGPQPSDDPNWTPPAGKKLVWSDEFDGSSINLGNWSYDLGAWPYNGEAEYYTDNGTGGPNAYVADGALVIKALRQNMGGRSYTSARLKTQGKKSWQYGTVVAKMKLPYGKGLWPAFWMLGTQYDGWPKCGEIDIMEVVGGGKNDSVITAAMHWGESTSSHMKTPPTWIDSPTPPSQDWHYYEMDWDATSVVIKFDGKEFFRKEINGLSYFHQPFYMILNVAVGGNWPGYPDATTVFPQTMTVDWVRVYQ